jgi:hypothetical protein
MMCVSFNLPLEDSETEEGAKRKLEQNSIEVVDKKQKQKV